MKLLSMDEESEAREVNLPNIEKTGRAQGIWLLYLQ